MHDATQWPAYTQATIAGVLGIEPAAVRVHAPYIGGAFGAGLFVWQHVILAVLAARAVGRPVKLVLTRPQMFTGVGHRPGSVQTIRMGARRDGELVAIEHASTNSAAIAHASIEPITGATARSYACANVATTDRQRRLNIPLPGSMRGPGHAQGNFALESAIDELAYELGLDPLELRLRNYAEVHPQSGLPWSSNALRECYAIGAERFGWTRPQPRDRLDARRPLEDRLRPRRPQLELVSGPLPGTRDHHPGRAGRRPQRRKRPGHRHQNRDAPAVRRAARPPARPRPLRARRLRHALVAGVRRLRPHRVARKRRPCSLRRADTAIPRHRRRRRPIASARLLARRGDSRRRTHPPPRRPARRRAPTPTILARHGLDELTADAEATPPGRDVELANSGPFAAKFVEVRVDEDLGLIRVARITTAVDAGRILNEKTARSQIIGGTIGGIGQALLEENIIDPGTGRVTNATFGDYLIPVNADAPDIDVVFVGEPDPLTPLGAKGVGEIGLVGIAAAIANGVHHATGRRIRSIPITLDRLL